ncbi:hypothetical protein [Actinomyces sp. MRS3W]|uniref:hypothetical protein n=1 Tax=Actinomyces sp. MRS3W TaxID=2800796 RepID=UPI0028FD7956|nr:hypothetical protein [Actinomyces sp. MRS3W]MDU0348426.1 hypothetical protein [Actinomyces sp. MRS3W]
MGIETWALVALVTILAVYLLPFLVGRREALGMSHAEDRYSSGLRLLATGRATSAEETCGGGGHIMIFRRRPEVRAMNRPEVRNVRALRKERELVRVRRAHEQNRERRRVAASHRATVALILLGVTLGTVVLAAVTVLPWWPVALPAALLCASAVAGRRAARASAASDRRERRRIAALERELTALTGHSASPGAQATASAEPMPTTAREAGETSQARTVSSGTAAGGEQTLQSMPAEQTARADDDARVQAEAGDMMPVKGHAVRDGEEAADASAAAEVGETAYLPEAPAAASAADTVADDASGTTATRDEKTPTTPPQGWHPVSVPAPTYTLAARAPRRTYEVPAEESFDSAPVPERPRNVHSYATSGVEAGSDEPVFHPIDLEAVLERRRAAGA